MPLLAFILYHTLVCCCILSPKSNHIRVWDVPPLSSIPSNNHKNLIRVINSWFYSFTLSSSPSMLSQPVWCVSSGIHSRLQPFSSLLLYIVPESHHVYPVCELRLHYHPYLVTTIHMCAPLYSFTLSLSPSMVSQSVHCMSSGIHSSTTVCSCMSSLSPIMLTLFVSCASITIHTYSTVQLQLDNRVHLKHNICCVCWPTYAV